MLCAEANMLYLESPAGVGFSYSKDPSYYIGTNDTKTGNNYQWHVRCKLHVKLSTIVHSLVRKIRSNANMYLQLLITCYFFVVGLTSFQSTSQESYIWQERAMQVKFSYSWLRELGTELSHQYLNRPFLRQSKIPPTWSRSVFQTVILVISIYSE